MVPEEEELTLIELEGEQYEIIDTVCVDDRNYIALIPHDESDDMSEEAEFTILEIIDDPDDEENCTLKTIDDEELYERIGDAFIEHFGMYEDEEDE
ncbi:MAG: DUF1292 domain-containing protein [Ruminiclostridium sp.]|nr:DUF1292 domain-containing protein [Ruminiclostridium sp.]